jgi:hypothetical protein
MATPQTAKPGTFCNARLDYFPLSFVSSARWRLVQLNSRLFEAASKLPRSRQEKNDE